MLEKRILINYLSVASGGAITYLKNITPHLLDMEKKDSSRRVRIKILVNEAQLSYLSSDIDRNRVVVVKTRTGIKRLVWEHIKLPAIVKENNIDVVFTPYQVTKLVHNVCNVIMVRNMEPFTFSKYKYSFKTWLRNHVLKFKTIQTVKNSDKVIAVSEYVREHIVNNGYASKNNVAQIYHGRDVSFHPDITDYDKDALISIGLTSPYVFTCGSLLPYRKCEDIIEAFLKLEGRNGMKLVVAGSGSDANYGGMLRTMSEKSDDIIMLGQVAHDLMTILFRNCHVFVTATETEACPNIAIEAMSSGCSILSSDIAPMPEMFAGAAELYKYGDVDQLAEKLARYIDLPKQRNIDAIKRAEEFTWAKCAHQTYKYITN